MDKQHKERILKALQDYKEACIDNNDIDEVRKTELTIEYMR